MDEVPLKATVKQFSSWDPLYLQLLGKAAPELCTWIFRETPALKKSVLHSRRQHKRVDTPNGVYAMWKCGRTEDISRVRDVSVGGLFLETKKSCPAGATVELHFLVEDGEIRASATVRYVQAGAGMGLQFKAVRGEDQARFSTMIKRLIQTVNVQS